MPILHESIEGITISWDGDPKTLVIPLLSRAEYEEALDFMRKAERDPEGIAPYVIAAATIRAAMLRHTAADAPSVLELIETLGPSAIADLWDRLLDLSLLAFVSPWPPQ
jgi:hypothetical protein